VREREREKEERGEKLEKREVAYRKDITYN